MKTTGQPQTSPTGPKKRIRRWQKGLIICLALLLTVSAAFLGYGRWWLADRLPQVEGTLTLAGLKEKVEVLRDGHGIPRIRAENANDLFFAQGYVTAQDRLFQMDMSRRMASGQLSEVVGRDTLDQDKFFRTLGLRRAAKASLPEYSDRAKKVLNAYAKGVNAYMDKAIREKRLPAEFRLMDYQPRPWTPVDSLVIGKYMAYDLGGRWKGQAFRHTLLQQFPKKKAMELFPKNPDGPTVIQQAQNSSLHLPKLLSAAVVPHENNGSNNWVLSGDKTESGKPLLANDPHLSIAAPAIWYQTRLISPDRKVSGVTFAGVPGIILGHNEQIAWGVTNVNPDVQDLYIEKRNPDNPRQFKYEGEWEKAKRIVEEIPVKDGKTVRHEVLITRHGPIVTEFALPEKKNATALSMRWTALDPTTELEAILRFNQAENWSDFKKALTYFHVPAQNFVFASKDGEIAYRANGLIPIRKKGDGLLPVPGWTDDYEWEGFIPWDELPTLHNPEEGFIATANNRITSEDYPYHLTHTWSAPYRIQRIRDVLNRNQTFTKEDMQQLQTDTKNLQAQTLLPVLLKELPDTSLRPLEKDALQLLQKWDFQDEVDQGAPLIFHLWMDELTKQLYRSIDEETMELFEGRDLITDRLIRQAGKGKPGIWIREAGGLKQLAFQSFRQAVHRAEKLQGDNSDQWKWGQFHQVHFSHPLGDIKPLHLLFNREAIPVGGSKMTVMAAGWNKKSGEVDHGASWRTVIDLANPGVSYDVVGPGQSGQVMSPWYHDQAVPWTQGQYHPTRMTPSDKDETYRLNLIPSKKDSSL
ncbi:penicillin acylase family protein [Paludifilum halophilum]|uniref:Penicillin acylase family protein n=1 Tax=Paludifilum halophilum TaxID=1642702 RepID=A0A235BAX5_9BACL|nr:penicillin acylase family protein [Paludifilum halophilum]OYD09458.1 penicillin acylase family protein [Paludifilum halophilum]